MNMIGERDDKPSLNVYKLIGFWWKVVKCYMKHHEPSGFFMVFLHVYTLKFIGSCGVVLYI